MFCCKQFNGNFLEILDVFFCKRNIVCVTAFVVGNSLFYMFKGLISCEFYLSVCYRAGMSCHVDLHIINAGLCTPYTLTSCAKLCSKSLISLTYGKNRCLPFQHASCSKYITEKDQETKFYLHKWLLLIK